MDFDVKNEHVIALLYRDKLRSITMSYISHAVTHVITASYIDIITFNLTFF